MSLPDYNGSMIDPLTEPLRTFALFLLHLVLGLVAVVTLHTGLVIGLFTVGMLVWTSRLYVVLKHYRKRRIAVVKQPKV